MAGQGKEGDTPARNTLGIEQATYERLLEKLDEDSDHGTISAKRRYTRVPLIDPFVRVAVEGDTGMKRDMVLACRNLSKGGVGMLHSSFMYPQTVLTVYLTRYDGRQVALRGKVVRVEHRGGVVHEIGVKFDKEINTRDFLTSDITESTPSLENVPPDHLKGDLTIATLDEEVIAAMREHLIETSLNFKVVGTVEELEVELEKKPAMILMDIGFSEVGGPELVKKLRVRGVGCPIAMIGNVDNELIRSKVRVCGADSMIRTPVECGDVLRVLGEFLLSAWDLDALDKARSRVDRGTLVSLCFELNKLGVVMDQHVRTDDKVALFGTCQSIRGLALLVGMHGVAGMAERLGDLAAANTGADEMEEMIEQVRLGCAAAGRAAA
ncbi:MAG: hypothetical protein AB8F26_08455 [Phycisphaerales bacterium]